MHELSIAAEILNVVAMTLGERKPLQSVRLNLGTLSGISPESLRFCFTELADQDGFGRPSLDILELPATSRCRECGMTHETTDFTKGCPACDSLNREILSGYECVVDSVTLEED